MLLYFLDQHAYPPEPDGMWIAGNGRADIIVRSVLPVHHFTVTAASPIRTTFTVLPGRRPTVQIVPRHTSGLRSAGGAGVRGLNSYAY